MAPTRFIILGHARTGSNLLAASLDRHPDVTVYGELFHDVELKRSRWPTPAGFLCDGDDPVAFLESSVFLATSGARAVGFRLFYDHGRRIARGEALWEHLVADDAVRVIHLWRSNLLESYVSRLVARRTGQWLRRATVVAPARTEPFEVDIAECRAYFDDVTERRAWARRAFARHPTVEITYDDLASAFHKTCDSAFEFLGVVPVVVREPFAKQAFVPLREQVANFDALRDAFLGGPYEWFFDHAP
jgi:LPS sulfotransferase NodH